MDKRSLQSISKLEVVSNKHAFSADDVRHQHVLRVIAKASLLRTGLLARHDEDGIKEVDVKAQDLNRKSVKRRR